MNYQANNLKGKCPNCQAIIAYTEVIFPIDNDKGAILGTCFNCQSSFKITLQNPDESHITEGAKKIGFLDFESESDFKNASEYCELKNKISYTINLNKKLKTYPLEGEPLYLCERCKRNLEEEAYNAFVSVEDDVKRANSSAINFIMANSRMPDYQKIIVCVDFNCLCGSVCSALFYRPFSEHMWASVEEYMLANISGALELPERVDGVVTKTAAMNILCKLILRWNLLSQKILVATPFVGHQYMSDSQLYEIWSSVLSWLDPNKSIVYTKSATAKSFKRAFQDESGIDYSMLVEYELGNTVFDNSNKKNDFHAKFFSGISEHYPEIMSGSANLLPGPSLENINLRRHDNYSTLYHRYLLPFGIKGLEEELLPYNEYSLLIRKNESGTYIGEDVTFSKYSDLINRSVQAS